MSSLIDATDEISPAFSFHSLNHEPMMVSFQLMLLPGFSSGHSSQRFIFSSFDSWSLSLWLGWMSFALFVVAE